MNSIICKECNTEFVKTSSGDFCCPNCKRSINEMLSYKTTSKVPVADKMIGGPSMFRNDKVVAK